MSFYLESKWVPIFWKIWPIKYFQVFTFSIVGVRWVFTTVASSLSTPGSFPRGIWATGWPLITPYFGHPKSGKPSSVFLDLFFRWFFALYHGKAPLTRFFRSWPFGVCYSWPFQGLSDLHLGDQRVTWKKLEITILGESFCGTFSNHRTVANPSLVSELKKSNHFLTTSHHLFRKRTPESLCPQKNQPGDSIRDLFFP